MHSLISKRHGGGAGSTPGYVQTSDPWAGQAKYAEGIAYTSLALILIFAIVSIPHRARSLHPTLGAAFQRLPGYASIAALLRWFSYRRVGGAGTAWGPLNLRLPALGVCLLMAAFFVAFTAWSFAIRPYYRPLRGDGSPPLALRTGWMALGLLPFIYALGSKVNFVAAITGSSHERLQVWHQWAGRFALFLATIHTLP